MEHDIFTRVKEESKGGLAVANQIARIGEPAVDVFKSAVQYEVVAPLVQKIANFQYLFRTMRPLRI